MTTNKKSVATISNSYDPRDKLFQNVTLILENGGDGKIVDKWPNAEWDGFLIAIQAPMKKIGIETSSYGVYDGPTGVITPIPNDDYIAMMEI